jgi:ribosomal protein S18 acetylase RimI-like enzyme
MADVKNHSPQSDDIEGDDVQIRRLEAREWAAVFPIVAQLRPHLSAEEFLAQARRQSHGGYELVGAFRDGRLIGVLGMRPVHTLARGPHLHIDDIVIDEADRRAGGGRALMAYAEADARARGMMGVFLDARPVAIGFYQALGYELHTTPSMKKIL